MNTNQPSNWLNYGVPLPNDWTSPTTRPLNLTTLMTVDALGRSTLLVDRNGNKTCTVYLDTQYEVRVYPGWNPQTGMPTGPTHVTRDDRGNGYTETLTISAAPAVTAGVPTGAEPISSLQMLSRTYYNYAGQAIEKDDYFTLSGVSYSTAPHIGTASGNSEQGTAGSSYYVTWQAYDNRGRLFNTITPNGTMYETDYDGLGRPVASYVGTVQVSVNQYDNGRVGDGTLTQVTQFTNDGTPNRITQYWFDWRDRQVASKQGLMPSLSQENDGTHRPITYVIYDNLGEQTEVQQYDGDGVAMGPFPKRGDTIAENDYPSAVL